MTSVCHDKGGVDSRIWWRVAATALAFGLAAFSAVSLMRQAGYIAAVWPANGILLAAIMVSRSRHLAAFLITAFIANVIADVVVGQALPISVFLSACSSMEMLTSVALMRLYQPGDWMQLESPKVLAGFWGTVCIIAPLVSATLASFGLHYLVQAPVLEIFSTWWIANALGLAVITPPLLILSRDGLKASVAAIGNRKALLSLLLLGIVTTGVFLQTRYPLLFLMFPPMVWVAFNAGFLGVAISLVLVTVESIALTIMGTGPMILIRGISPQEITIVVQLFLAAMLIMGFLVTTSLGERSRLERELEVLATTDALTGLATRRRFDEHFQTVWAEALRERHSVAVMMLDADFFKAYNDGYGHLKGDECIKALAIIIRGVARRPLDLAVRYGGEEFLLLLSHTTLHGATLLAAEIHESLAASKIAHRESPYGQVSLSIGVAAVTPDATMAAATLIEAADEALYKAKRAGRSRTEAAGFPLPTSAGVAVPG